MSKPARCGKSQNLIAMPSYPLCRLTEKIASAASDSPMDSQTATHVMDIEGGIPTPLSQTMFISGRPFPSSDGLIVFSALVAYPVAAKDCPVLVVPVSGARCAILVTNPARAGHWSMRKEWSVWSPAANQIAFVEAGALRTQRLNENGLCHCTTQSE